MRITIHIGQFTVLCGVLGGCVAGTARNAGFVIAGKPETRLAKSNAFCKKCKKPPLCQVTVS